MKAWKGKQTPFSRTAFVQPLDAKTKARFFSNCFLKLHLKNRLKLVLALKVYCSKMNLKLGHFKFMSKPTNPLKAIFNYWLQATVSQVK